MSGHPGENYLIIGGWRPSRVLLALLGLLGAAAALSLPGPTGQATGIASVLAVGATALLAGFGWGALIVAAADVLLLGAVWPLLAFAESSGSPGLWPVIAASAAFLTALPGLLLFAITLPRTVEIVVGGRGRLHRLGVGLAAAAAVAWLVVPVFSA